jgi:hypothetical protein
VEGETMRKKKYGIYKIDTKPHKLLVNLNKTFVIDSSNSELTLIEYIFNLYFKDDYERKLKCINLLVPIFPIEFAEIFFELKLIDLRPFFEQDSFKTFNYIVKYMCRIKKDEKVREKIMSIFVAIKNSITVSASIDH